MRLLLALKATLYMMLAVAVVGITAATLAGFFGESSAWFDYAAHFRPHLGAAAVIGIPAALLLAKGWRRAALVVPLTAAAFGNIDAMLAETRYRAAVAEDYVPVPLKIAAVNVYFFNREPHRVEQWLRQEQPDVVVLTEIERSWGAMFDRLADLYPYQATRRTAFVTMIARQPWTSLAVAAGPRPGQGILVARFDVAGRPFTVIGAHPASPIHPLIVASRNAELDIIAQLAAAAPGPVVAMGDFNATPWSAPMRRLVRTSPLRYADLAATTWPTFLPHWLGIKIDHIMLGKGCGVAGYGVGPDVGSDHRPVVATIRCAARPPNPPLRAG